MFNKDGGQDCKKKKKKMKACRNKSTCISIDDEIQNILVRNPALTQKQTEV